MFLGPVELLRFTTPEPYGNSSTRGVVWEVEKDVTDYMPIFKQVRSSHTWRPCGCRLG